MTHNFPRTYPDIHGQDENMTAMMWRMFPQRMQDKQDKICPTCRIPVDEQAFTEEIDWREYLITGVCLPCQDKFFAETDE